MLGTCSYCSEDAVHAVTSAMYPALNESFCAFHLAREQMLAAEERRRDQAAETRAELEAIKERNGWQDD